MEILKVLPQKAIIEHPNPPLPILEKSTSGGEFFEGRGAWGWMTKDFSHPNRPVHPLTLPPTPKNHYSERTYYIKRTTIAVKTSPPSQRLPPKPVLPLLQADIVNIAASLLANQISPLWN